MTGAPTTGGGRVGPVRDRWLVLGAVGILVVAIAVGTFAVVSNPAAATPSPAAVEFASDARRWTRRSRASTPMARGLRRPRWPSSRRRSDRCPASDAPPRSSYHSGTLPILMVEAHWSELTDAQRKAILDYIGPAAGAIVPAAFHPALGALHDVWQSTADQAAAEIGSHLGHPLGIPIRDRLSVE